MPQLTKCQSLVTVMNILASNSNQGEFHLSPNLDCVVAILYFLHLATHLLEWRSIHLIPVDNSWFHNIIKLQRTNLH